MKYALTTDEIVEVIKLYSENIGEINPASAVNIEDACQHYKYEDLVYAIKEAAKANIKNWRYIETILVRRSLPDNPNKGGQYDSCALRTAEDITNAWEQKIKNRRETVVKNG